MPRSGAELTMTAVRMIPAHEIVRRTYPRPPPQERDQIAMATGKAIDGALSQFGHQLREGRHPTQAGMGRLAESLLDEALEEAAVVLASADREKTVGQIQAVLRAYRRSEIAGLARPRTRVFLIDSKVGVYAQPDYWDGKGRFFEMKSFHAIPPSPEVALQLRLFQLAFPKFEAVLVCLDRHSPSAEVTSTVFPSPTHDEETTVLRLAYDQGLQFGQEKVLEYLEGPFVHYSLAAPGGEPASGVTAGGTSP